MHKKKMFFVIILQNIDWCTILCRYDARSVSIRQVFFPRSCFLLSKTIYVFTFSSGSPVRFILLNMCYQWTNNYADTV